MARPLQSIPARFGKVILNTDESDMSNHLKVTPHKTLLAKGMVGVFNGKVRVGKVHVPSKGPLRSAKGGGFKGRLEAMGKVWALKKKVKGSGDEHGRHADSPALAGPVLHGKNISSIYKKTADHKKSTLEGGEFGRRERGKITLQDASMGLERAGVKHSHHVKGHGNGKVILMEGTMRFERPGGRIRSHGKGHAREMEFLNDGSMVLEKNRAETARHGKGRGRYAAKGRPVLKFRTKGLAPADKAPLGAEPALPRFHKGHGGAGEVLKRAGGTIKGAILQKGLNEAFTGALPEKRPIESAVEPALSGKTVSGTSGSLPKAGPLKAQGASSAGTMIRPLEGAVLKGGRKKRGTPQRAHRVEKKGGRRASVAKKKPLKGLSISGGAPSRGASSVFTERLNSTGPAKFIEDIHLIPSAVVDGAPQGGQAGPMIEDGDKRVLSGPQSIINVNAATGLEKARGSAFTTLLTRDLQGAEAQMIKQASHGVVMSLRQADKEILISLEPEELGHMEIKVRMHHGLVEASIVVNNSDVMAMLNANNAALKEHLARQGLMLGGLDVTLNHGEGSPRKNRDLQGDGRGHYKRPIQGVKSAATGGGDHSIATKALHESKVQGALDLFI